MGNCGSAQNKESQGWEGNRSPNFAGLGCDCSGFKPPHFQNHALKWFQTEGDSLENSSSSYANMWYMPGIKAFLEEPSSMGLFHCLHLCPLLFPPSPTTFKKLSSTLWFKRKGLDNSTYLLVHNIFCKSQGKDESPSFNEHLSAP